MNCPHCDKPLVEVDNPLRPEIRHRRGEEAQCPGPSDATASVVGLGGHPDRREVTAMGDRRYYDEATGEQGPMPTTTETPTERNRRIYEDATARGEPVLVVRAQDILCAPAIQCYRGLAVASTAPGFLAALDELLAEVQAWQRGNPDKMKLPDLR